MRRLVLLITLLGALLVAGCSSGSNGVQSIGAQQFLETASQPGVTVIDVRTPQEYAAGHLEGAVNMNVESPDFANRISSLNRDATYEVYCHSGRRSTLASDQMSGAGFGTVYNLDGGIADLQAAGGQIVTD